MDMMRRFTPAKLAEFDGRVDGRAVLVAYEGRVYDVSGSFPWRKGFHWGCAYAGRDVTDKVATAPHGPEMLGRVRCVGWLAE